MRLIFILPHWRPYIELHFFKIPYWNFMWNIKFTKYSNMSAIKEKIFCVDRMYQYLDSFLRKEPVFPNIATLEIVSGLWAFEWNKVLSKYFLLVLRIQDWSEIDPKHVLYHLEKKEHYSKCSNKYFWRSKCNMTCQHLAPSCGQFPSIMAHYVK